MTSNMYVGMDIGKTGGIFVLYESEAYGCAMPVNENKNADVILLQEYMLTHCTLLRVPPYKVHVLVEKQHRNKDTVFQEGRLTAFVELMDFQLHTVRPQEWQKEIFSRILADIPKDIDTKEASILFCQENEIDLPTLNPTGTKLHDGIADAFCMAVYCRHLVENM